MTYVRIPIVLSALGVLLTLGTTVVSPAEQDCEAAVEARLDQEEKDGDTTRLRFTVEVTSTESCADIVYDLIIEQRTPNNLIHRIRIPRTVRLVDGTVTEVVEHEVLPGYAMLGHEARPVECRICERQP